MMAVRFSQHGLFPIQTDLKHDDVLAIGYNDVAAPIVATADVASGDGSRSWNASGQHSGTCGSTGERCGSEFLNG